MLLLVDLACGEHDPVLAGARPLTDLTDLTERYISIRPRSEPLPHV
jgi:hypothetical protein